MTYSPTAHDITYGLNTQELTDLSSRQKAVIAVLMARAAERSYRRGVQQGARFTEIDREMHALHQWRYEPGTDISPMVDSWRTETAVCRLLMENDGLRRIGFPHEVPGYGVGTIDMDDMVDRLQLAAAAYRGGWKTDEEQVGSAASLPAIVIKSIGLEAYTAGGARGLADLYDELTERHGPMAARGVSSLWDGIGGWSA